MSTYMWILLNGVNVLFCKYLWFWIVGWSSVLLIVNVTQEVCVCAQLRLTFCYPMDCSLSGSSFSGIFQARILEWVVISSSRDLPDSGIKPVFLTASASAGRFFTTEPPACNVTHCPLSRVSNNKWLLGCVPWFSNGINPPFHTAFCNCLSPMEYSQALRISFSSWNIRKYQLEVRRLRSRHTFSSRSLYRQVVSL